MSNPTHCNRKPLYAALVTGAFAISASGVVVADPINPAAVKNPLMLAAHHGGNPCNPCAGKKDPCPCNPCKPNAGAAKNPCNPCNPCAGKKQ